MKGVMPSDVIREAVRKNFGRMRRCYEDGVRRDPTLAGRVAVEFAIDSTGRVSSSIDGGSDLPDRDVVDCVVKSFLRISFPSPPTGTVEVVYPLLFTPDT